MITSYSCAQEGRSMQGAFGTVTIDGKMWNQIALRPVVPVWKFALALDLVFISIRMVIFIKMNGIFLIQKRQRIQLLIKFIISDTG